ncbi:polysaccharide biosynthesis protein [Thalassospira lucentensis]|uniref:Polysaccharide biosynthesis protein n=1 Tax=Thalassospira lucentensis TaxID=168935 RepID=A0A154L8B4_9PROT|nr:MULTISPECIES: polysaccharide biosynthesis/export family protein [Thalassospira]KZB66890.1 polysaccharide biosynthesis protein [Thalassospira lucentensis]MCH2273528.1 polysaccharide export protein [Thalassospira sp.]
MKSIILTAILFFAASSGVHAQTIYTIDSGDKLRITVFDEESLSGDFSVGADGSVTLPLIGTVKLRDLTPQAAQKTIANALADDYLRHPVVSIDVIHFRPVYIIGEVNEPGEYGYASGMNVLNAVALGGGYTYRADQDDIIIMRGRDDNRVEIQASEQSIVLPGDIIHITERYF